MEVKKVAIYTLTRDRLKYTKHCFRTLKKKSGYPYDHFVVDNGSTDGTEDWLAKQKDLKVKLLGENKGIGIASNIVLDEIADKYDLIIKMDNDCEVVSDNLIKRIVEAYEKIPKYFTKFILSPRVEGIRTVLQRFDHLKIDNELVGITPMVGGIFMAIPGEVARDYRFPEDLPKAKGYDSHLCQWFRQNGGSIGYIETLEVNHYRTTDGQEEDYPKYFKRKKKDEIEPYSRY